MTARLSLLVVLLGLASSPAFAADRLQPGAPLGAPAWRFSLAAAVGFGPDAAFVPNGATAAASLELSAGRLLSPRWALEGVVSGFAGVEGGFWGLGLRPLFLLGDHFELGAIATAALGPEVGLAVGPHLGFHAGGLYAFYEPLAVVNGSGQNPFDNNLPGSSGVALLPLRIGVGVRF